MSHQDQANGIKAEARAAEGLISETAEKVRGVAADAGGRAQELAREAGRQATAAAQTIYGSSNALLDAFEGAIRQNPLGALLVAGAAGYGIAYLFHRR